MITPKETIIPDARYSVEQTAKLLGVSRWTIQRYVKKGLLRRRIWLIDNRGFFEGFELIEDIKKIV